MKFTGRLALAVVTLFCVAGSPLETVRYTASLIQHLATVVESGVPKFVFFEHGIHSHIAGTEVLVEDHQSVLDQLLQEPVLANVTKLALNCEFALGEVVNLPSKVTMLLVHGNQLRCFDSFVAVLRAFDPSTKVIVFTLGYLKKAFERIFEALNYYNVVYVAPACTKLMRNHYLEKLPEPSLVFRRSLYRNLGRPISMTKVSGGMMAQGTVNWLIETGSKMNTTVTIVPHLCYGSYWNFLDPCFFEHFLQHIIAAIYHLSSTTFEDVTILFSKLPQQKIILIPEHQLNIYRLMVLPFDWEVWMILILLLSTVQIVFLLFPAVFLNDPILISVCGYERYDLNKATACEKIVLFSLIVLMFLMTCAYEAKLVSFISSRPTARHIRTLQELAESDVKVKINPVYDGIMFQIPLLANSLVNTTDSLLEMDGIHAYVCTLHDAKRILLNLYDSYRTIQRYGILEQSIAMLTPAFILSYRSPLVEALEDTQAALTESGIWTHWKRSCEMDQSKKLKLTPIEQDNIIHFADLVPAWFIISIGLILSGVVCIGESFVYFLIKRYVKL